MTKTKKTWRRRAGAALCAVTLGAAGGLFAATPAYAAFDVTDEAGFLAALTTANGNGVPDIINVDVGGVATVFDYTDSLQILEALTINGPGSTLLTLQSVDNDGIDVPVGPLTLNGASVLGSGGHGIDSGIADLTLNDVNVSNSTGGGVSLAGGSLTATNVIANDTNSSGDLRQRGDHPVPP